MSSVDLNVQNQPSQVQHPSEPSYSFPNIPQRSNIFDEKDSEISTGTKFNNKGNRLIGNPPQDCSNEMTIGSVSQSQPFQFKGLRTTTENECSRRVETDKGLMEKVSENVPRNTQLAKVGQGTGFLSQVKLFFLMPSKFYFEISAFCK